MRKKKVFLAHNNPALVEEFAALLSRSGLYELVGYAYTGEGFEMIESFDLYDIVIVKDALTYMPGIYMVKKILQRTTIRPELILVLTPFSNAFIRNLCQSLDIIYRNVAVTNAFHLMDLLYKYDLDEGGRHKKVFDTQYEIIMMLKKCGLQRRYLGYKYFEYILNLMFHDPNLAKKKMKELYALIGEHFHASPASVEKAMRICLKQSLRQHTNYYVRTLFGIGEHPNQQTLPSTTTFIQVCLNRLKDQKTYVALKGMKNRAQI